MQLSRSAACQVPCCRTQAAPPLPQLQSARVRAARPLAPRSRERAAAPGAAREPLSDQQPACGVTAARPQHAPSEPRLPSWLPRACVLAAGAVALSLAAPAVAHAAAHATAAAAGEGGGSLIATLLSFVLHLDKHLSALIAAHGPATYALLWAIVFCETGLVLTPFLPGDSLLFAAGAFAGMGKLHAGALAAVFVSSAVLGDAVNYAVGAKLGKLALERKLLNAAHVDQTARFYAKYGGKTVVLARFVPIVRTFAPFVAGIGSMDYGRFAAYNVGGAVLWTLLFVGAGFFFGNLPVVQKNFTLVVLGIIAVSLVPVALEVLAARREARRGGGPIAG